MADPTLNLAPDLVSAISTVAGWARERGYSRASVAHVLLMQAEQEMVGAPEDERRPVAIVGYQVADRIGRPEPIE